MKRTANWCWLVLIAALALPKVASAQDEGTAYANFYAEEDCAKKAPLGEQFISTYKTSQYAEGALMLTANCYYKLKNFAKVSDLANRVDELAPKMAADNKVRMFEYALDLATQSNNSAQMLVYGEKVIALSPNDVMTLMTLSTTLANTTSTNSQDKAGIQKGIDYAQKATKLLGSMDGKSVGLSDAEWAKQKVAYEGSLHQTLGTLYFTSQDFDKASDELVIATKDSPKDNISWLLLGLTYNYQYNAQSKQLKEAVDKSNALRKGDQALYDEAKATADGIADALREKRDQAINALATATALGGTTQQQAMTALQKLYAEKNNGSTQGLNELIASKKPAQ